MIDELLLIETCCRTPFIQQYLKLQVIASINTMLNSALL